ncbi:MAG: amino acid ABC transporter ATP-binding protein [Pyrinomonadaceae bacterium]
MITVSHIGKQIGSTTILRDISFSVEPQTVLGIIGSSGSGKTTLLRCLNGLERIDNGSIDCSDVRLEASSSASDYRKRVQELRRQIGTVFQHFYLFPHLSALQNVIEAPVHVRHTARDKAIVEARQLLESVGLAHAIDRYPESLSGGEQQRVAIARALAMHPAILLFDEPTSALDPKRASSLRELLRSFVPKGHTMVIVSHSISFLHGLADNVVYMDGGEIVEMGPATELLTSPKNPRTREFIDQGE